MRAVCPHFTIQTRSRAFLRARLPPMTLHDTFAICSLVLLAHRKTFKKTTKPCLIMPRGSGNNSSSGYNSQGNHYNTPGGTNSNSASSYHCELETRASARGFVGAIENLPHSPFPSLAFCSLSQTRTLTDRTTTPMITVPPTTTMELVPRLTRRPLATRTIRPATSKEIKL